MSRSGPIKWSAAKDREIAAAIERQAKLHDEWRESQAEAQRAVEAIAAAQRASDEARSDALSIGKPDPGAADLSEHEVAAAAAAERRDLLSAAFAKARKSTLALADQREAAWQREAERALDKASGAVAGALDVLAAALDEWEALRSEVALARSGDLRERGRPVGGTLTLASLRGRNGDPMALPDVLRALRVLPSMPAPGSEPVMEPEPERVSNAEVREVRALGGVVLPSRG